LNVNEAVSSGADDCELRRFAARIRMNATTMVAGHGLGYLGQALSTADFLAALFAGGYFRTGKDRFVLSPGHYAIAAYAVFAELGLIERAEMARYGCDGALLEAISTERSPCIDISCGSLGQGLSGAIGLALAARFAKDGRRVFVLLSDGEMEEGQTWEASMFAAHHALGHLVAFVDANNSQVDGAVTSVTTIEPLAAKWRAFGWEVQEVDGHDMAQIRLALGRCVTRKPHIIIGRTHVTGRLKAIPATADGHFLKIDSRLSAAILEELAALAQAIQ
jgi:transketolase